MDSIYFLVLESLEALKHFSWVLTLSAFGYKEGGGFPLETGLMGWGQGVAAITSQRARELSELWPGHPFLGELPPRESLGGPVFSFSIQEGGISWPLMQAPHPHP